MPSVQRLNPKRHDRAAFACGEPTLDRYLREQAAQHHRDGVATTHVLVDDGNDSSIVGYYTLSAARLLLTDLREEDRRRLPSYPVPAVRMGRLAVALAEQGKRVMIVDALHEIAARFYRAYGFHDTASRSETLYLPLGKS